LKKYFNFKKQLLKFNCIRINIEETELGVIRIAVTQRLEGAKLG